MSALRESNGRNDTHSDKTLTRLYQTEEAIPTRCVVIARAGAVV